LIDLLDILFANHLHKCCCTFLEPLRCSETKSTSS